jgi:hypothetical protein
MDTKGTDGSADSAGEPEATLRRGMASQTETACRASYHRHGGRAQEGAR